MISNVQGEFKLKDDKSQINKWLISYQRFEKNVWLTVMKLWVVVIEGVKCCLLVR